MWFKAVIALCFAALIAADDALDVGDSDFDKKLTQDTALVMFFAPWCGHCKKMKPEFEKAATTLKLNDPPIQLLKVDCTGAGKELCSKHSISGYPTLKIFRGGQVSADYNGPREASGIVKYMKAQVGPASKALNSIKDAEAFLDVPEVGVVFFGGDGSKFKKPFLQAADIDREKIRFAHSLLNEVNDKYGYKDKIVLFRPKHLHNKFEDPSVVYKGDDDSSEIRRFIKKNYHGLVGHRTQDNARDFETPMVIAYFNVDYVKNAKGTNYWRNRIIKVAQGYGEYNYAIANKDDFQHELNEYGLTYASGDKPVICARYGDGEKYVMEGEFSMDTFETFLKQLREGELEPYIKSEPVPDQTGPVLVAVGKNFEELVTTSGRDALIEFYAPWCGHCKKLAPTFDELGTLMEKEDVDIIKMDATANDVPSTFNVRGFPTIYWKPKDGLPRPYDGGRDISDFTGFIAKEATTELKGFDRKGKPKKSEL